jgi:uncharacterized protein (TIGR02246 family)
MNSQTSRPKDTPSSDEVEVHALYRQLLDSWNQRSADEFAALFDEESHLVGFDGSTINGKAEIESHIGQIFADHQTAAYVGKVRGVRFLTPEVAILRELL